MDNHYETVTSMIGISALALLAAVGWLIVYVQKADAMRYEVLECMGHDRSRVSYDMCMEDLRASK